MLRSKLGVSPFDALLVGLYRTVGLTVGSWEIVLALVMMLMNAALLRKKPEYAGLLTAFVIGFCIDFWIYTAGALLQPSTLISQIVCFLVGLVFNGFGIALYLQAKFAPVPLDRMMLAICERTGWSVTISRMVIMLILVLLAFLFHGPIGVGSIVITFVSGVMIHIFLPFAEKLDKRWTVCRSIPEKCCGMEKKQA